MSTKEIILLIGIILIIIAILSSIKRKGSEARLVSTKVGVPLGILGVLMVMYTSYSGAGYSHSQIEQITTGNKLEISGPVNSVKVISPIDQDSVNCRILTMGVYPENHSKDIWVMIRPTDDRYYPQSDHTNTSYKRDGEWQVVTRFGGDLGEAYDLIIYEADASTSSFFSSTIEKWNEEENFPGLKLEEIPSGATEVDRIKIYTKKNCRGVF
ncbi:MAG: hypothetical protein ED556_12435 [Winogradskyella sp.]|uniref:hypothetical protein n=1 Tax=Winogradskyella sp. TaxID=1883156 RepID=UPI000F3EB8EE|nr:hypothetical protein [Winogradskyella sp.]RNC84256.1 MAG: hypothetical protein ED556_12435 [Winogradskyella sp.]